MKGSSVAVVSLGLFLISTVAGIGPVLIDTNYGPISGLSNAKGRGWLGIPFAEPPVGALRWYAPQPHAPWGPSPLNTTTFGPGCPQKCVLPPHTCPSAYSEDCLTLNVYAPLEVPSNPLPVMAFLPGGRFEQGSSGVMLYDGFQIVSKHNAIVVTINYRLGSLGFLKTPQITGNFGILDQILALTWIQDNIANFGGDPSKVMLYGQSAGAMSTAVHLVSPLSTGLFHSVIVESDPFALPMYTVDDAHGLARRFADDLDCSLDDIECLRSVSADNIVAAEVASQKHLSPFSPLLSFVPWTPIVDGNLLTDQPRTLVESGQYARVPMIIGTVYNEALLFVWEAWNQTLTRDDYYAALADVFLEHLPGIVERYPPSDSQEDQHDIVSRIGTDYIFICPTRAVARAAATFGTPVYKYLFNHVLSFGDKAWGPRYPECIDKVCHASELPFIFDSGEVDGFFTFTQGELQLASEMIKAWVNFATSGNPNLPTPLLTAWPAYDESAMSEYEWATGVSALNISIIEAFRGADCDFFDYIGYNWGD